MDILYIEDDYTDLIIDVDKLDYLIRDGYVTGFNMMSQDEEVLKHVAEFDKDNVVIVKGIYADRVAKHIDDAQCYCLFITNMYYKSVGSLDCTMDWCKEVNNVACI